MSTRPQFYPNNLQLPQIDQTTLRGIHADLQKAVLNGFLTPSGIALAYLRLAHQTPSLAADLSSESLPDFYTLASARIPQTGPNLPLEIGGLSPLPSRSPVAAAVLRIFHRAATGRADTINETDIKCIKDAVQLSLSHGAVAYYHGHHLGADEMVFGRAGLLWALLNIRACVAGFPSAAKKLILPILEGIPSLVAVIIEDGREGSAEYVKKHGNADALPLMWTWKKGNYGIGWYLTIEAGIIPILLACEADEITNHLPEIGATITGLCNICIANNGHLPTTIPPHSSSHEAPLVQICHGAPAFLALLACAMKHHDLLLNCWAPEWEEAIHLAAEKVWEQGLLSKGGSLCHGIAGNAWPLLLLQDVYEYHGETLTGAREEYVARTSNRVTARHALSGEYFLSRALAMLLHCRETRPYNRSTGPPAAGNDYRMPDQPYSFFEGLAGTLCAWAEACAAIMGLRRKMELNGVGLQQDAAFEQSVRQILGFPCLGGNGLHGVL
ncbi:hypothetical protein BJX61DRAFT_536439 [Aspergillus egyptiacus]|nr:hypothetical protein BJX61DRAFT_536439 [Aspergillus egyptiacus]